MYLICVMADFVFFFLIPVDDGDFSPRTARIIAIAISHSQQHPKDRDGIVVNVIYHATMLLMGLLL